VSAAIQAGDPVISIDAKKKELVGDFKKTQGACGDRRANPRKSVCMTSKSRSWDVQYVQYLMVCTTSVQIKGGSVSAIDHDTSVFAVNTIRRWWEVVGRKRYPRARRILIIADGGGSNGSRIQGDRVKEASRNA